MSTMNISLPESMKNFVDERVQSAGYSTSSEYLRDLIRQDQLAQAQAQLKHLLAQGMASAAGPVADAGYWASKRKALKTPSKRAPRA